MGCLAVAGRTGAARRPRTPCGSRVGPDSCAAPAETGATWAQGALVSVSAKNRSPARGYLGLGDNLVAAAGQREGSWVPVLALSPSRGPPALQGPLPSPITTASGNEPGGLGGVGEPGDEALGCWQVALVASHRQRFLPGARPMSLGQEFLCPPPSFHGPCLRKPGIDQIASSMPTPGAWWNSPTGELWGQNLGTPDARFSGRCCDLFLEPGRDTRLLNRAPTSAATQPCAEALLHLLVC